MPNKLTRKKQITGDIFGGVTASIIALPLALAFGVASGAGAQFGLYGAIILGFVAAAFGGTPVQISGPTGPMTVVMASAIVLFKGDIGAIAATVFIGGILQLMLGITKLGGLVKYIPYPVISGFMTGIGVIIILLQLHPLVGAEGYSSPLMTIKHLGTAFSGFHINDAMLGADTMLIVFLFPKRYSRIIPSPLLALILCTIASVFLQMNPTTIGHIPAEIPELVLPTFSMEQTGLIFTTAASLAVLGSIDSLLTSLVADSLTKTSHKPNKELIAQGAGNALCAFFGGLPGAGATMRTVVNVKAGGTTRLSGIIHSFMLLAILLGLGKLAENIPLAVLSGILIKVGFDIIDYRFLRVIKRAPKYDIAVMLVVLSLTVFVDLIMAVGAGVVLASILLTYRISQQAGVSVTEIPFETSELEKSQDLQLDTSYSIRVIEINGPFFFGSTSQIVGKIGPFLGTKLIIFNCKNVPFMDYSAVFALSEMLLKIKSNNIMPFIVVNERIKNKLIGLNIEELISVDHIFTDFDEAVKHGAKHAM